MTFRHATFFFVFAVLALSAGAGPLDRILAKWRPVEMPFHTAGLTAREQQLVRKLAEASSYLDRIYWRQSDPAALELYETTRDPKLKRLLLINGSRFDLLNENRPFVDTEPWPPGGALYPKGWTRQRIEAYVQAHPDQREAIYNPYIIVREAPGGRLETVPYRVAYRPFLEKAARTLREAAALTGDAAFAKFLRLRADALLTDDYYASDLAWLDLRDPKIDVIFAPYETYLDGLLDVKTSYGAAVLVRDAPESRKLAAFQKYVPDMLEALPLAPADRPSKRGHLTPMEVMDAPYRAGDLRHGYQAVADNLPNDPRIHQQRGSKKIFFKNFMDARVNYVILPLAAQVMRADQAAKVTAEGYLVGTLLHEIAHGLGPAFARRDGRKVDIREAIGPVYSALEEAKADVVGMFGLAWLLEQGALSRERAPEYYASYAGGIFRTLRFGTGEAHGRAELMEFHYLRQRHAIERAPDGRYFVDMERIPTALAALAKDLLEIEAAGDRARAEALFARYGKMPADLHRSLDAVKNVPVDIDPVFALEPR